MDDELDTAQTASGARLPEAHSKPPSDQSGCEDAQRLMRESSLVFVLVLSLGLWAAIWGVVILFSSGSLL